VKILFLTHYYPPEVNAPANRVHEHARVWVREGHEVTVVTGVPNHPRGEIFPGYENRWFQEEEIEGVRVLRTWMYITANEGFFRRTLNYVLFAITAVFAAMRADRPDVVVATSPQFFVGLAGAVVSRLRRRPFVLEVRDLWPDSIVQLGQMKRGLGVKILELLETALYRSAAGIVVVTRSFEAHIRRRGIDPDRISLIYNGIDVAKFHPRPANQELLREHGLEGQYLIAYVGTLGLAHGLPTVLSAAAMLRDRKELTFLFIGDGADRARLEGLAKEQGLDNVRFLGLQPREAIPDWLASIDLLLVMLRDLEVFHTVIPSKLFEFLAQERPVVLAAKGETREMVLATEAGWVIDPEDPDQLAEVIDQIRAQPEEAERRATAGREWVEREFRRDDLALRMAGFLESVCRR
jgi:glycosyltransferase involved in cell wall biosynthesis